MKDFDGKVAVVTGGASGIGLGMARAFGRAGMKVVIADLDDSAMAAAEAEFGGNGVDLVTTRCDVSDHEQIHALADTTINSFGAVHILCNNAGIGIPTGTHNMKLADWKWIIDVCLWGPIYGVETFLPLIEEQGEGHINTTSSMAGLIAGQMMGAYNVAKHGVVALMASLERDLRFRESPVRASVLCPGPIDTKIVDSQRNRDADDAAQHVETEQGQKFWDFLTRSLAAGMDPAEVGPMVLDAIEQEKFWVLTHPEMGEIAVSQAKAMLEDRRLTR